MKKILLLMPILLCKICAPFPSMFVRLNPYCNMAMCYYNFDMDYMTKSDLNERFGL